MNAFYEIASKHFDFRARVQFEPCCVDGLFVGLARDLTEDQVKAIEGRPGFELLSDEELEARLNAPKPTKAELSGDPITDSVSMDALESLSYSDLVKLAKARGINLLGNPKKAEVLAALQAASDPLSGAPEPPKGLEG